MIKQVISYGDTGANLAGLLAAERCGISTSGKARKGFQTEKGSQPILGERFGLVEVDKSWAKSNIEDSDATVLLVGDKDSSFAVQVISCCRTNGKPYIVLDPSKMDVDFCLFFFGMIKPTSVNVVGDLESEFTGITKYAREYLFEAFNRHQDSIKLAA